MVRAKPNSPKTPVISVPKPEDERIRVGKVGIMAAVGLTVGILWPRFAGFHLVPAPPSESASAASASASASAEASGAASSASVAPSGSQAVPAKRAEPAETKPTGVMPPKVTLAQVVGCRSKEAGRQKKCEAPSLGSAIEDPLRAVIACDGADGAHGVLSVGFDVDFSENKLDNFVAGRSTTLPSALAKRLVHCAEKELSKVSLEGIAHPMDSYRVFYKLEFGGESSAAPAPTGAEPDKGSSAPNSDEVLAASGRVTVTWDAALVRSKPKDGEILARVLGGTRLTVVAHQGDWYRVKYDGKGSEGWVFRGAIGQ